MGLALQKENVRSYPRLKQLVLPALVYIVVFLTTVCTLIHNMYLTL